MTLREKIGQHVTVRTVDGPLSGVLLDVSNDAGPQYLILRIPVRDDEYREEIVPWHEIKAIFPSTAVDEEVISQLEQLRGLAKS